MTLSASLRLSEKKSQIMDLWVTRALAEVSASKHQEDLALRNSLPEYLGQLVDALSTTINRTDARKRFDKAESTRVGQKHGKERATSLKYTMDQLIFEYHILREVIFDVLEEEADLSSVEREVIICSVEQAVNDAATQFSNTSKDTQNHITNCLAHDFRNPLTVARMNLELILRRPDDAKHVMTKAALGITNLDRLDRLIQDLLDGSRVQAGAGLQIVMKSEVDLNVIIQEVIVDLSTTHKTTIHYESCGRCLGKWNESGLRRVLENLTTNAIKYGLKDSAVTISLRNDPEKKAIFSVHNYGKQIKEEDMESLFDHFHRLTGAEEQIGWGLGLSVVKGMVNAHQGEIKVESLQDKGTTFTVTLPKVAASFTEVAHAKLE